MGAKKTLQTFKLFDNVTVPANGSVTSDAVNITNLDNISIQFKYNTATIGVDDDRLEVLVSNDNIDFVPLNIPSMISFDQETLFTLVINLTQLAQPWIKLSYYSFEPGESYVDASIFGKDLN